MVTHENGKMLLLMRFAFTRISRMEYVERHRGRSKMTSTSFDRASHGRQHPIFQELPSCCTREPRPSSCFTPASPSTGSYVLRLCVSRSYHARIYHFLEFFIIAAMSRKLCSNVCANCIALVLPSLWKAETEKMKPFFLTL